ncbi:secreted glycosyl hydrolase : Putative membrane-bound dehydrogenase OS=Singulisphaera acidiphila (strain ATCC BAA-1392 / DSM 18658 / VKM B-2454 / MOB10) GN=Sinac_2812 PE=4 SV=1: ThuA: Cytochrom_C [Gemmataceae bacterium]|nr:secreted glycosyl hydrolase : Putative membrane-bound dehydrogenase OS=Singulisphaera acidiphila (strain ATCC BAA-1392 / DSM 18658 / VKM B-2454 / MOB10) GN=Sinac_2812 PE=4 SV=1: ThuA: Cytochrom_C [Gemmataceae bacterium]VTT97291.1 secreted glycosyl hydrolase : Putative membrane-bound dehydrogenase OS=Singulisphaera acidiphila (strain ATCC BAA-1392 / DSM 18658 / VKM B-2454 / MOB10) GN=Sinac_2812 PE=4 SV=1: ThuA: Cytochrom_C [Gemmataceae bacterium]
MRALLSLLVLAFAGPALAADPPKLNVLFLGDAAGHKPAERFKILQPVLAKRGIALTYTDKLDDLNAKTLAGYDALVIYANHTKITPEQEKALLDYAESGKGFVPLHCASYCFLNSPKYVELVGAQFRSHGTGTFRTDIVKPDHEVMKGFPGFASWDETYVHTKHNDKDRTVLEIRTDGDLKEPWTWVRTPGKARVFYTAWGHDHRTWEHPGFQNLVERGIRWTCGQDPQLAGAYFDKPEMTQPRTDVKPFEYAEAKIPFYPPRGGKADPITKMQKPLSVEESVKHFVTPKDFEVKVFVTEDKLGGKPIAMNWDERGRLWVSVTVDYPNELQPEGKGRDKIVVCEDTDGDGACDAVTTFADKVSIATSLLPYAGGLIVHQAPHTLFLKDTDGDGRADVRQVLFTGWATNDTHAGPSNLHYGFDNWVYGAVGYAGFKGEVNGEAVSFRQGFYRFKIEANPERKQGGDALKVTKLEFLRSTSNNTWGLCFNEAGELFGSTANGCPIVHMPIPNRYYEKVKGLTPSVLQNIAPDNHIEPITEKVRQVDWHGGFTAASNISIYTARTYPKEYWNRTAFISEPTGHLTAAMTLQPSGADYKARYGWNLLASDDEWSSPVDAQVGPDGHMWVIDWYAFIVQHNPTPAGFKNGKGNAFETPARDKTHGRIYRVVYTKAKPEPALTLKDATPEKLVETLKHHNLTWRLHAQRLLVERGKTDVVPALVKLLEDKTVDETGLNAGAVHAVWTLAGLGQELPAAVVKHPSWAVRRSTVLAYGVRRLDAGSNLETYIASALLDTPGPSANVRLAAALAAADVKGLDPELAFSAAIESPLCDPTTTALDRVALLAAASNRAGLVLAGVSRHVRPLSADGLFGVELLARHYAASGGDKTISSILVGLTGADVTPELATAILSGLAQSWPANAAPMLTDRGANEIDGAIAKLLAKLPPASRGKLIKLASTWGRKGLDAQLAEITKAAFATLADAKASDADRVAAAQQVIEFQPDSDDAAAKLLAAVDEKASAALATGIFDALAASKSKGAGAAVVAKLKDLPPAARPAALRLVLAKGDSARAFLDAVEKGTLRFDLLALDQRTALASHADKEIAERAKKLLALGGGLPSPDRQKVIEELKHLLAKTGDVANGKKVFTQHCAKCHKYGGEGTQIGPDLTGFAVHPKEELLIHIIDPSRSVEGNFKAYRVLTADDRTIIGILGAQTGTSVEIIDGEAKRHALSKDDIASLKETDKSLMPEGFEKVMKPEEFGDLLEFLTQKGKFVPLPLDKVATVVSTKDMFFDAGGAAERLVFPDWKPKVFEGVPFVLVDPAKDTVKNVVMLNGPNGVLPPKMPKSVSLPFNGKAKAVHLLSGIGGWNSQRASNTGAVSMVVRLTYDDGATEDHPLKDGVHFADYIGRFDVPGSKFAFALRSQQVRYLAVTPKRDAALKSIEFVKGTDRSAPIVMAVTVESP